MAEEGPTVIPRVQVTASLSLGCLMLDEQFSQNTQRTIHGPLNIRRLEFLKRYSTTMKACRVVSFFAIAASFTPSVQAQPYTLEDVAQHAAKTDCWTAISGIVYDLTAFGKAAIMDHCTNFLHVVCYSTSSSTDPLCIHVCFYLTNNNILLQHPHIRYRIAPFTHCAESTARPGSWEPTRLVSLPQPCNACFW